MFLAIQNLILVNRDTIQGKFWVSEDVTSIWGVYGGPRAAGAGQRGKYGPFSTAYIVATKIAI